MSLDNIITNRNKVAYTSLFPSDKIVYEDTFTYAVAGGAVATPTFPNPHGVKAFITLSWSVDGTNFYPGQAFITAANPYEVNGWVSASTITIRLFTLTSPVTFTVHYTLDTIT